MTVVVAFEQGSFISLNVDKWIDKDTANEESKEEIEWLC